MTTHENGRQLQRQVFIYNRPKTDNETIYQAVDVIHSAIYANRQIRFKYCEWTVNKKLVQRKNGADYIVSPWSLTWDDENYYLVAYDEAVGQIRHYRVDKMQELAQLETARKGREQFENFDLAAFAKKTCGMFGGKDEKVTLVCRNELAGVILDRFGTDIMMIPSGPDCFRTPVTVSVSSQFFGWLTGIGSGIRIESPAEVKEEYKRYLQGILEAY
jgi:predicted DNA-binding transcriptional regulator YafY